jgi:hypothetical protein
LPSDAAVASLQYLFILSSWRHHHAAAIALKSSQISNPPLFRTLEGDGQTFLSKSNQNSHQQQKMASSTRWVLLLLLAATTEAFTSPLRQYRPRRRDAVSLKSFESEGGEHISIEYCTGCRWMLRAAWMSQELLTTFQQELDSVTLIPSRPPAPGGVFVSIFLSFIGEMLLAQ